MFFIQLNPKKTTANQNSFMSATSAWCRRAQIPHRGDTSGTPRTYKGLFSAYIQAPHCRDLPEEDIRVLSKIIPAFSSTCGVRVRPLRT